MKIITAMRSGFSRTILNHTFAVLLLAALAAGLATAATAQTFPLTIEHKFDGTTIPEKSERVATVDANGADNLLALGGSAGSDRALVRRLRAGRLALG